jgi:ribosome-binding protein aMBF1 (putative translation factor)
MRASVDTDFMTKPNIEAVMNTIQKKRLESAGFKVGSVQEFLGLDDEEMALIELKVRLVRMLRPAREAVGLTQHELATRIGSSQSRVAKMETYSPDASLDLICRALLALGVTPKGIGKAIAGTRAA